MYLIISRSFLHRMRNISNVSEKIRTHILYSITFFFLKTHALYEVMWKNIIEPDRPQKTIWRMRIVCCIPKATDTHSEYAILFVFHCNNGCPNTPERYVIHTVLLISAKVKAQFVGPILSHSENNVRFSLNKRVNTPQKEPGHSGQQ